MLLKCFVCHPREHGDPSKTYLLHYENLKYRIDQLNFNIKERKIRQMAEVFLSDCSLFKI
jgi:hypothetical protein